jgi:glycosyltransferase involved in cell wall biosynthesis
MSHHLSVCIPTYKRPELLAKCLDAVSRQDHDGFTFSIIVVDNDPEQSGKVLVLERVASLPEIVYVHEGEPNISRARNRAVATAGGEYVAFIDDDEYPQNGWLRNLHDLCLRTSVDGVLGPVLPHYEPSPPDWLVRSGVCVRDSFPTGTELTNSRYMRTGNVLFRREIFSGLEAPFDPRLGRTGGEDADFFARMLDDGRRFVWCDEGAVFEVVPHERQTLAYHLKRALIRGLTEADRERFVSLGTVRSLAAIGAYAVALPILFVTRYHLFVKYLVRCCDHLGKILAHLHCRPVRERTF